MLVAAGAFVSCTKSGLVPLSILFLTSACWGIVLVIRACREVFQLKASANLSSANLSSIDDASGAIWLAVSLAALISMASPFGFALAESRMPRPDKFDLCQFVRRHAGFEGMVIADLTRSESRHRRYLISLKPLIDPHKTNLTGRAPEQNRNRQTNLTGRALLIVRNATAALPAMTRFRATASIQPLEAAVFPWEFDNKTRMARMGVFCVALAEQKNVAVFDVDDRDHMTRLTMALDSMRQTIRDMHCRVLGEENGSLLASMVLGDRAVKLPGQLSHDFREVGLSHLLAASGFNLTVVIGTTYWIFRRIPSQIILCLIGHAALLMFVALAGPSPSVIRAALMCSMILLSRCFFRHLHSLAALCLALFITVIIDPLSVVDLGCQLSYAAAAGIICGATALARVLANCFRCCTGGWLFETLSVITIAQATILPIQLYYFWQTGLLFLPANLLVTPLIAPVTVIGFAGSIGAILSAIMQDNCVASGLTSLIIRLAGVPLEFIVFVVRSMASIESARMMLGPPALPAIWAYYFALVLLLLALGQDKTRASPAVLAFLLFLSSCHLLIAREALSEPIVFCLPNRILFVGRDRSFISIIDRSKRDHSKIGQKSSGEIEKAKEGGELEKRGGEIEEDAEAAKIVAFFAAHPAHPSYAARAEDLLQQCHWRILKGGGANELEIRLGGDSQNESNSSLVLRLNRPRFRSSFRSSFRSDSRSGRNRLSRGEACHTGAPVVRVQAYLTVGSSMTDGAAATAPARRNCGPANRHPARTERVSSREVLVFAQPDGRPCCRIICGQRLRF